MQAHPFLLTFFFRKEVQGGLPLAREREAAHPGDARAGFPENLPFYTLARWEIRERTRTPGNTYG
jgi:hypothetical protein